MLDSPTGRKRSARAIATLFAVATTTVALTAFSLPAAATAQSPTACKNRTNTTYQALLECVTLDGVRAHQAVFQEIAEANDDPVYPGTRAAGTEGYAESAEYVADKLREAGYTVTLDEFDFTFQFPTILRQLTPTVADHPANPATGTGEGDVTAAVTAVDLVMTPPRTPSTSGCEAADFAGFPAGNIALIQRGTCPFALKAQNAVAASASAVILFNQGDTGPTAGPGDRFGPVNPTLAPITVSIPVVGTSFAAGEALNVAGATARVRVETETRTDVNVIAELPGRTTDNVVMAGAHLDSETLGPGINDNGSGSAAILETALMMAKVKPENTLRFAWWGAEESGLIGSTAYVNGLSQAEKDRIALYLNYDMVGSPNYVFMVYDADQSSFPPPAGVPIPPGSAAIEDVYESYYTKFGIPYDDTQFSGRSDYQAFIVAGIPSGGLFTGAEVLKTAEQAGIWGGTVGAQFDPCYHIACDTFANNSDRALEVNSDLIAFAQLKFAFSTESVNGVAGRDVPGSSSFSLPAPAGPEGTFVP
jgi:Zn-dependent M28 family amino/carboxypeptidase